MYIYLFYVYTAFSSAKLDRYFTSLFFSLYNKDNLYWGLGFLHECRAALMGEDSLYHTS